MVLISSAALAEGGSVEGRLTVTRDNQPAFAKNALIYITGYATKPPREPAKMAQTGRAFDKVVLPVVKGGRVAFTNEEPLDSIYHHVFTPGPKVKFASEKYRPGDKAYVTKEGALNVDGAVTVFCDIHKEMISTIYLVPNDRFVLLSTAEGASAPFKIDGIKPGKWKLVAWHRSAEGTVEKEVEIKEGQTTKIDLTLEGASKIEKVLFDHKRINESKGYEQKADGGWRGERKEDGDGW